MDGDRRIAELATRQRGVVSARQLRELGLTDDAIRHRVATGRLHRRHRGVYLVGHLAHVPLADETAALLACGPGAVLSHRSAAAVWRLAPRPPVPEVTVPPHRTPRHRGIVVHRQAVPPAEVRARDGLRTTSPRWTLQTLAAHCRPAELQRLVDEAHVLKLVTAHDLRPRAGARGAPRLRAVTEGRPGFTRSRGERRLVTLLERAGLPRPELDARVAGLEVDALWRAERVVAEIDAYSTHGHRSAFERDRRRDLRLRQAGLTPVRVTWDMVGEEPERVVAAFAVALTR